LGNIGGNTTTASTATAAPVGMRGPQGNGMGINYSNNQKDVSPIKVGDLISGNSGAYKNLNSSGGGAMSKP
jgi:hypothetical protein